MEERQATDTCGVAFLSENFDMGHGSVVDFYNFKCCASIRYSKLLLLNAVENKSD